MPTESDRVRKRPTGPLTAEQRDLAAAHVPLALAVVEPFCLKFPDSEDAFRSGACLALIHCARRFDPAHGRPFSAMAKRRIQGSALDVQRGHHPVRSRPGRPAPKFRIDGPEGLRITPDPQIPPPGQELEELEQFEARIRPLPAE